MAHLPQLPKWGEKGWLALVLGALLLVGAGLVIANSFFKWESELARDFGIAFIISGVMGATVEFNLRTQLARDVVEAALGYVFPEEFRAEVRQITEYKFFCEKHRMRVKIEFVDSDKDCVRVTIETERRVRNITSQRRPIVGYIHIDEYRFPKEGSKILDCRAWVDGEKYVTFKEIVRDDSTLLAKTDEIYVNPKECGTMASTSVEVKRPNDHMSFVFLSPTRDPEAIIDLPPEFDCSFGFGPHDANTTIAKSAHDNSRRYSMTGTYFPHQHMRLRFWPTTEIKAQSPRSSSGPALRASEATP
jgi:hypothetical protein